MRRVAIVAALTLATFAAAPARAGGELAELARRRPLGAGAILGEPTGVSAKFWLSATAAVDLAAAWSLAGEADLHLHGDYLVHRAEMWRVDGTPLHLYYGVGGRLKTEHRLRLGVRGPVGVEMLVPGHPVELFAEFAPILDLLPDTSLRLNLGVGARYFF